MSLPKPSTEYVAEYRLAHAEHWKRFPYERDHATWAWLDARGLIERFNLQSENVRIVQRDITESILPPMQTLLLEIANA